MFVPRIRTSAGSKAYSRRLARAPVHLDPYASAGLAGIADDLGISGLIESVKAQVAELRQGLTISSAASTAAAIGVVLLLMRTGGRKRRA